MKNKHEMEKDIELEVFEEFEKSKLEGKHMDEQIRLDKIRRISNIIQALENVITQCDDLDSASFVVSFARRSLDFFNQQLRRKIHI